MTHECQPWEAMATTTTTRRPGRARRPAAGAPTRAVGYLRVSTTMQADHGVSLDAQRAAVEAYAALYQLELVAIEVDAGESASSLARPALQRALAMLRSGAAGALLVAKLDRLTRSVRDLGTLVDSYFRDGGAALLSVAEQIDTRSAGGRLVLNVLSSVGQWEREAIGERTSAAMRHMRDEGRFTGGRAPYGFTVDEAGALVEVADEQATIARARAMRAEGRSLRAIAGALAEEGRRSRTGRALLPEQISRMVAGATDDDNHDTRRTA